LKYLPHGKQIALLTDARFSGFSTGGCIGPIGPEGLAGGPIGKLLAGDIIGIVIDRKEIQGSIASPHARRVVNNNDTNEITLTRNTAPS
jgi:dihydroxyacid dehydratase/phosphogluconate dehydratase